MFSHEERERQALEDRLNELEVELEAAIKNGASEMQCEHLREQIVTVCAAFNRGCN